MSCELCRDSYPHELWRDADFVVVDASDADLPVFVRVIARDHVKELSQMSAQQRARLLEIITRIEREMIRLVQPDKVNIASLGNMVPHVHWHIVGRWQDDAFFPGSIWSARLRDMPQDAFAVRRQAAQVFLQSLPTALSGLD